VFLLWAQAYNAGSIPHTEGGFWVAQAAPLASCLCLTYARPDVLRESIWCFLQQAYPNKELIVINDHPEPLYLDRFYPGVHLYNVPNRFGSLGEKRNYSVTAARGEYLFPWDDDDLFLPWRLQDSMSHLLAAPHKWMFKPMSAWMSTNNRDYAIVQNPFHNQVAMRRCAFDHAGGYRMINSGEDIDFESRISPDRWFHYPARLDELIYVYRWGNNVTHISGMGVDTPGTPTAWDRVAENNREKKGGVISPGFDRPYWQDLATAAASAPGVSPAAARSLAERLEPYQGLGPLEGGRTP
jgi:glycosyltransferase involved in cell wall biosynthesis